MHMALSLVHGKLFRNPRVFTPRGWFARTVTVGYHDLCHIS